MPQSPPDQFDLKELSDRADVTPRTVHFYIQQGLLPSSLSRGPGARYGQTHLERLLLIRRLQRQHFPLAEIRRQLAGLDDDGVRRALASFDTPVRAVKDSALDYLQRIRSGSLPSVVSASALPARPRLGKRQGGGAPAKTLADASSQSPAQPPETRSQWDRVVFTPDIELHVRRPLTRDMNRRVDELIAAARHIFEEDK